MKYELRKRTALGPMRSAVLSCLLLIGSACGGIEEDYAESTASADPALGVTPPIGPLLPPDRLHGVGFESTTGWTVALYADGTLSKGTVSRTAAYVGPYGTSYPPGYSATDVVGTAITNTNRIYTWYKDGRRAKGVIYDLDRDFGPTYKVYTIPPPPMQPPWFNRTPRDIVGMAFLPTNNYVYTWYRDGYVSVGSTYDLGLHTGPGKYWRGQKEYTLPPGKHVNDIIDMEIKPPHNSVYTWYRDGTYTIGKSWDLDRIQGPRPFTK